MTPPAKLLAHDAISLELWIMWKGPASSKWQRISEFGNATDELLFTPQAGSNPQNLSLVNVHGVLKIVRVIPLLLPNRTPILMVSQAFPSLFWPPVQ